jgi:GNAT superfamily N-acetyltransferase
MVSAEARGKGLGTLLCEHSQKVSQELNYKAMQFNLVVVCNVQAGNLWSKLGFETAGKITKVFRYPILGYVEELFMYKWL